MPEQEPSIKNQSKAKATPQAGPAPNAKAASTGGVRRTRNGGNVAERIRQRAYEIWEREGRPEGRQQAHWEQAEREVAKVRAARQVAAGR
ncbi:MAG: DUF2934 domain-containing protein [Geminicoccales bacterium]